MAGLVSTVRLHEAVILGDQQIAEVLIREPVVREFVAIGPMVLHHRKGGLTVTLDLPGRAAAYLKLCILSLAPAMVGDLLDRASLVDGMRLKAAMAKFFFAVSPDDVDGYGAVLAFDWRLMTLAESDELALSELAYHCKRLSDHCRRRDRAANQRKSRNG